MSDLLIFLFKFFLKGEEMTKIVKITLILGISLILVGSFSLLGCQEEAKKAEEAVEEETVAEEAVEEETVAEEAVEEEVVKAVAEEGKRGEGLVVRFDAGGPEGGTFAMNLYEGAMAAGEDYGVKIEALWNDWDPGKEIETFKETIAAEPTGAVVIGQPGDDAYMPLIDEAFAAGIIVTAVCTPLPETLKKYKDKGFGYAGANLYSAGYSLGEKTVADFDLAEGDRAMVWGLLGEPTRGERTQGAIDALEDKGLVVDYLEIAPDVNADPVVGVPTFTGYVAANPDAKLVITDHGGLTATGETYMTAAGKEPGEIIIAGFDSSPATVEAVRNGYVQIVIDQQPWLQGYLGVQQIVFTKLYKFSGLEIDTGAGFITLENIEEIAPLAEKLIR
jgi:simple sugar transport system substrate-binding protein